MQQAMADVWNIPQVSLPGFLPRLMRSLISLVVIGGALRPQRAAATVVTASGSSAAIHVLERAPREWFCSTASPASPCSGLPAPNDAQGRDLVPGAVLAGLGFTLLITVGSGLVQHQLRNSSATYGQFGLVIGLVGFLFLLAKISLYGAELNPVMARHLWATQHGPDNPTKADNRVLSDIARQSSDGRTNSSGWDSAHTAHTRPRSTRSTGRTMSPERTDEPIDLRAETTRSSLQASWWFRTRKRAG